MSMIAALFVLGAAQTLTASPITIGTSFTVRSKAMSEERIVNVVLPDGYAADSSRSYPVVFVIDGGIDQDLLHVAGTAKLGAMWGRSQDTILVGIATKDRRRELTGPASVAEILKKYPTAGHSADFRRFIRDEVKPMIAQNFRTSGKDAVVGESLAGLFIVETWLNEPDLFGSYAAISPSLWWDAQKLSLTATMKVGKNQADHPMYLTIADEGGEMQRATERLVEAMRNAGRDYCYFPRPDLTHATIYHTVTPTVFQFLLPPKEAPAPEFGFEVKCSPKS